MFANCGLGRGIYAFTPSYTFKELGLVFPLRKTRVKIVLEIRRIRMNCKIFQEFYFLLEVCRVYEHSNGISNCTRLITLPVFLEENISSHFTKK